MLNPKIIIGARHMNSNPRFGKVVLFYNALLNAILTHFRIELILDT